MDSSLRGDAFPPNDFSSEFQFDCAFGFDGEFDFGFGGDFNFLSAQESGFGGASFGADPLDYDGVSIDCSIEDYVSFRCRCCRCIRRTNRHFRIESVKKSCWYVQFLKPGIMCQMTHELSSSDSMVIFATISACHFLVGLPGACGSVDVVHIKWGCCPTGDINRAKGKEGYPTFAHVA
jgi:hypothetical protein